jgi:glycerol kinase
MARAVKGGHDVRVRKPRLAGLLVARLGKVAREVVRGDDGLGLDAGQAGLAEGVWPSLDSLAARWQLDAEFEPAGDDARAMADALHAQWLRAVERSRDWVEH